MIPVTIEVKGETQLLAHLEKLPDIVRARLLTPITRLTQELLMAVRAAEPDKTGALRAATHSFIDQGDDYIRGKVKVLPIPGQRMSAHNVAAAALEYGVHASFTVASHRMRLNHVFRRPTSGQDVMVSAYNRRVNIKAERFLRDPLERIRPRAIAEIERALNEPL